jgi:hypothetical protein
MDPNISEPSSVVLLSCRLTLVTATRPLLRGLHTRGIHILSCQQASMPMMCKGHSAYEGGDLSFHRCCLMFLHRPETPQIGGGLQHAWLATLGVICRCICRCQNSLLVVPQQPWSSSIQANLYIVCTVKHRRNSRQQTHCNCERTK